ncbi:MAG TPA: YceI family protein [Ohtaekwangia sp.]|nr:YceI family protein [Ohtaekwangia sp.]
MKNETFSILGTQSTIEWVGRKVTGPHYGTIAVKEGKLRLRNGKLADGRIVVDTTSISILDITDPTYKAQFGAHLASDDFFSSQNFPEAVLQIVSVDGRQVTGNLTIRGITHPVQFETDINEKDDVLSATARLVVDRTNYGIKFRSGNFFINLGDTLIHDNFELNVSLTAKRARVVSSVLV